MKTSYRLIHANHPHWLAMDSFVHDDGFGNMVMNSYKQSAYICRFMDEDLH